MVPGHPATVLFWRFFRFRVSPPSSDSLSMLLCVTRLTTLFHTDTQKRLNSPLSPPSYNKQPSNGFRWPGSGGHSSASLRLTLITESRWE